MIGAGWSVHMILNMISILMPATKTTIDARQQQAISATHVFWFFMNTLHQFKDFVLFLKRNLESIDLNVNSDLCFFTAENWVQCCITRSNETTLNPKSEDSVLMFLTRQHSKQIADNLFAVLSAKNVYERQNSDLSYRHLFRNSKKNIYERQNSDLS